MDSRMMTVLLFCAALFNITCRNGDKKSVSDIGLKRGNLISCGPPDKEFGEVGFETSCSEKVKSKFNLAVSLLHSFEYDEAEKVFANIIDDDPDCAMAYWGVAMANYHPLWDPPTKAELEKGEKAITLAQSLTQKSKKESDYIEAIALFYKEWSKADHRTRSIRFEKAMEKIYAEFSNDKETSIFYALSLDASANPSDTSFVNQKKAGAILSELYKIDPNHPGIVHYIIHSYDYPALATIALPAARKYASIAPSSAHAQHMPSHIFTRLGLWDDAIKSDLASTSSAKCYAENAGIKGHWDEELHGMDYLEYAYLQKGANSKAKAQCDYLKTINEVYPVNFKVAYAFAAIPSRYLLENKFWKEAASLKLHPANFPWQKFPWQKAIVHFTRFLGSVRTGHLDSARVEITNLQAIHAELMSQKDLYKSYQVEIQIKVAEAWITLKEGKKDEAIKLMHVAADMEDMTQKHPVTPGEVIPARELLGDMLLHVNKPDAALEAYEEDIRKHPNRFNGLFGAGSSAEEAKNYDKAKYYYQLLTEVANSTDASRPELEKARLFLKSRD
jgi:tetratricopeptide (TPR) repeat protein